MEDIKKSFSKALDERMTSPLFGSFILSWITCNWRVVYILLFSGDDYKTLMKFGLVKIYLKDYNYSILIPLISTALIVSAYPILTTGAFWFSEYFNDWKVKIRNRFVNTQLLSLETSIALRRELFNKDKEFNEILNGYVTKLNESSDEKTKLNTLLSEENIKINTLKDINDKLKSENNELLNSVERINAQLAIINDQKDVKSLYLHHRDELLRNGYKDEFPMTTLASNLSRTDRLHLLSLPTTHKMSEAFLKEKFGEKSFQVLKQQGVFVIDGEKLLLSPNGFALLMILKGMEIEIDNHHTETEVF